MKRNTKQKSTPPSTSAHGLVDLEPSQVAARMAEVARHLDAVDELLRDAEGLNAAQRRRSPRLRGDGEVAALNGILEFATVHAGLFGSLAADVDGNDPMTFDTQVLKNRLENSQTLVETADRLATLQSRVSSCALHAVALMKPTTLKAYAIAKTVAGRVARSELIFPAQDFYRAASGTRARSS